MEQQVIALKFTEKGLRNKDFLMNWTWVPVSHWDGRIAHVESGSSSLPSTQHLSRLWYWSPTLDGKHELWFTRKQWKWSMTQKIGSKRKMEELESVMWAKAGLCSHGTGHLKLELNTEMLSAAERKWVCIYLYLYLCNIPLQEEQHRTNISIPALS